MLLTKLYARALVALCALAPACHARDDGAARRPAPSPPALSSAVAASEPTPSSEPAPAPSASAATAAAAAAMPGCPAGMQLIPGGKLWIGSDPREKFAEDESPRFRTELAPYCLDQTEVTVDAYRDCVAKGACSKPIDKQFHCNNRYADRGQHPINCVSWKQANAFCAGQGRRLPREVEWEAAARGGERYQEFGWGDEPPDGRTCWKQPHSCKVGSFAPGAFGLLDMTGNVWEWTSDYYGPYPWPAASGFSRVYRGGSWSRRFDKWLHTRLRNRDSESYSGSHLGFRCALSPPGITCPFGADAAGECLAGVLERACDAAKPWNGVRCAAPGEPRCRVGWREVPGHGCALEDELTAPGVDVEAEKAGVTRARSPELDPDCQQNFRDRPHAFRYSGGTHRGRNLVSRSAGCKNRDVGVGFNSTCCP